MLIGHCNHKRNDSTMRMRAALWFAFILVLNGALFGPCSAVGSVDPGYIYRPLVQRTITPTIGNATNEMDHGDEERHEKDAKCACACAESAPHAASGAEATTPRRNWLLLGEPFSFAPLVNVCMYMWRRNARA